MAGDDRTQPLPPHLAYHSHSPLDEGMTGTLVDPAEIVAGRAELSDVANAISALPPRQREALVMREFCGLSYEQVAAAMSVSESAVDSLLSRARRRLSEQVGYMPRAARGALVVPASLREELSRLIPGLDPAGAAVASGAGGAAALVSLGSAPVATKVVATGAAAVALALPVQATVREDESARAGKRAAVATQTAGPEGNPRRAPAQAVAPAVPAARDLPDAHHVAPNVARPSSSGHGPRPGGPDVGFQRSRRQLGFGQLRLQFQLGSGSGSGSSEDGLGGAESSGNGSGTGSSGSGSSGTGLSGSGSGGSSSSGSEPDSSGSGSDASEVASSGSGSGSSEPEGESGGSGSDWSGSSGSGSSGDGD